MGAQLGDGFVGLHVLPAPLGMYAADVRVSPGRARILVCYDRHVCANAVPQIG